LVSERALVQKKKKKKKKVKKKKNKNENGGVFEIGLLFEVEFEFL